MKRHQPIVRELIALLEQRPELSDALKASIRMADLPGILTVSQYYHFLDAMVVLIPADRNLNHFMLQFYYLIDLSPGQILQKDGEFQGWARKFAEEWGSFLDTPESALGIESFLTNPKFHMSDYYAGPSGWLTFNQFFARHARPGKRPVDARCDDGIIVSSADSVFQGQWPIRDDSRITVKGLPWSVMDLLAGSPFQERFKGGIFTHSFLDVNDYHWFHIPVGGVVREVRKISGRVTMDVVKKADGSLGIIDGTGYQFAQDRGLLILDTALGLVAVLPIGMAQVSSVNITTEQGAVLAKGEEFGFFSFGGSDIVTLFEAGRAELDATVGQHYNQGRTVGHALAAPVIGAA